MRYTYAYKTSDGVRHEASMDAESREVVFASLREKGIKAIKVVAADGSKANGEIRGIRKGVLVASVIGAALLAAVVSALVVRRGTIIVPRPSLVEASLDSTLRRQLIGDAAVIEMGIKTGWSEVFELEGERFLASFAIPGVRAGQRSTTEEELARAIDAPCVIRESNSLEARQILAMVEGMKSEAKKYIAAGGKIAEYGKRLTERQDAEIAIYERAKSEIEAAKEKMTEDELVALWERRNGQLRNLGIRLVPLPE